MVKESPFFEEVLRRAVRQPDFWLKMFVGGLLSFVPVLNLFAFGFLQRLSLGVQKGGTIKFPAWSDWRGLFSDGLGFAVVWLFYWLLPVLVAFFVGGLLSLIGLAALGYLLLSATFVFSALVFGAALYRYNMRSDFKDLLDVSLILRMSYRTYPKHLVPAVFFLGVFALNPALYGFTLFFGFTVVLIQSAFVYLAFERGR